jgi:uncharacterized protein (DUF952 family)
LLPWVLPKGPLSYTRAADTVDRLLAQKAQQTQYSRQDLRDVPKIYKICSASAWREAERQGIYRGSADDLRDEGTARKHFAGQKALFLVEVEADVLGDILRWERSRNDELFPHLYGELDPRAVTSVHQIHTRPDGSHDIPELKP